MFFLIALKYKTKVLFFRQQKFMIPNEAKIYVDNQNCNFFNFHNYCR